MGPFQGTFPRPWAIYTSVSLAACAATLRDENLVGRGTDAGEAWSRLRPQDSAAGEPVEPSIAAMSAQASLISGRLLPAAGPVASNRELITAS
jgi:hypothetical protein